MSYREGAYGTVPSLCGRDSAQHILEYVLRGEDARRTLVAMIGGDLSLRGLMRAMLRRKGHGLLL